MIVISGCLIVRDNKILMVKEAKKECYGKWSFPAGHVEEGENITDAAIREVYEETGCKVKLTGVLPISYRHEDNKETLIIIKFTADIIEENIKFNKDEILDVKWINIEDIKNMTKEQIRGYDLNIKFLKNYQDKKIYPLEIFLN